MCYNTFTYLFNCEAFLSFWILMKESLKIILCYLNIYILFLIHFEIFIYIFKNF